ncbi:hypothetical protein G7Y79_00067g095730 [Physcia stellaris]|nr:hypothetical protein G7Y79_00067g095730 [Physcia stellaris]
MVSFDGSTTGHDVVKAFAAEAKGKTVLITGPSESGIGAQTAIFLAAGKPQEIFLAGRNKNKIQPVIDQIQKENPDVKATFVQLDLADLSSVRNAAKEVSDKTQKLDVLINNAGIMALKDYATTKDGIEMQFGSNHIGHFLLTNLLMPKLLAAGKGARVVNVSSFGYMSGGIYFDDPNFKNGAEYNAWTAYAQSKTANILFTTGLVDKLKSKGLLSFALNPGLIFESKLMVNVSQDMFADGHAVATAALKGDTMPAAAMAPKSLAAGSATSLLAALDPELSSHNGAFLVDAAIWKEPLREHAVGSDKAEKLWALSEKLVGEKFDY